MNVLDWLRSAFESIRNDESAGKTAAQDDDSPAFYEPAEIETRADVTAETGLTPERFVIELLDEQGGRIRQQRFTDLTSWSETLVSRVLQEMEANEQVERIEVGTEKFVYLPGHVPEDGTPGSDDEPTEA